MNHTRLLRIQGVPSFISLPFSTIFMHVYSCPPTFSPVPPPLDRSLSLYSPRRFCQSERPKIRGFNCVERIENFVHIPDGLIGALIVSMKVCVPRCIGGCSSACLADYRPHCCHNQSARAKAVLCLFTHSGTASQVLTE